MMRRLRVLLAWLGLLALAACGRPSSRPATITLTYASPYPPTHPFSKADIEWMHHVEKASGGRLRFKPYWSGGLLSSDESMTEIRHGIADIGLITPIYARGGAHMLRAQSGFYGGVRTIDDQVRVYDCLAARFPQFGRELTGLHVLAVQGGNFPGVLTRSRSIRSLADFRGLRLRAQSDAIDVLRQLGADPVNMPMADVYSALAKGVIDGVVAPADTIRSLHFSEVAQHFTAIRFSRGSYPARAISDAAWNRLTPDLQALLTNSRRVWEKALNDQLLEAEAAGIAFGKEHHMQINNFPPAEQARFDQLYNQDAMGQAQRLREVGLNGVPVVQAAQAMIAGAGRDGQITCPGASPTGSEIR